MDGNGQKKAISTSVFFFLAKTGLGSENAGTEMKSKYADVRNTDVEPERITD